MIPGDWTTSDNHTIHNLRLGTVFKAHIQRGGSGKPGEYGSDWQAFLNGTFLSRAADVDYLRAVVDWHVLNEMNSMANGYRAIKARALESSVLFSASGWAQHKERLALEAKFRTEGPTSFTIGRDAWTRTKF
jgi:hypothetical protein